MFIHMSTCGYVDNFSNKAVLLRVVAVSEGFQGLYDLLQFTIEPFAEGVKTVVLVAQFGVDKAEKNDGIAWNHTPIIPYRRAKRNTITFPP